MNKVIANMAGTVWKVLVNKGDPVQTGQEIIILESMKMAIPVQANLSGVVKEIKVLENDFVNEGDVLVELV